MSARNRKRRKLKAEINVVPYIDVMLVLLIIFMVTAPLLNLGVDVELPEANAKPIQQDKEPVIVAVLADGSLSLTLQGAAPEAIDEATLLAKLSAFVRNNPNVPVLLAGDGSIPYEQVMQKMALLQQAGVAKVGLMAQPVQDKN
jgi:biopolymer transport protein TolR